MVYLEKIVLDFGLIVMMPRSNAGFVQEAFIFIGGNLTCMPCGNNGLEKHDVELEM